MNPRRDATPSRIMTAAEVAQYFKIHLSTVYRLARRRQIPAFKVGGNYRFDRDAIEKWMVDQQVNE
jgi:excisionase family DNA binding protein